VTQNNGRQLILDGGRTHLLAHRNHKFEKFMSLKISTNDLERIEATSADNVKMHTTASCVWRVTDVMKAAKMSAETMRHDGRDVRTSDQSNMNKLQNDVLKQATASLAAFIGEIRYSDSFHLSAQVQEVGTDLTEKPPVPKDLQDYSPIWDASRMNKAVSSANSVTAEYGITILSINIISAVPADLALQNALAKGAVASAEAEQAETVARGDARATRIRAQGDAEAAIIRADGAKKAADTLSTTAFAVELARLEKLGSVFSDKTSFFFGASPHEVSNVLSNPRLVHAPGQ
jgi:regulator of protease activity HflC (stomatin/prohibitin superfamily)